MMVSASWFWSLAFLGLFAAVPTQPPEKIQRKIGDVFSREEFGGSPEPSWLARKIGEFFARLGEWLGNLHAASPVLFWLLLVGCVALLALLVFLLVLALRRTFVLGPYEEGSAEGKAATERIRQSAAFREEALRHAARGDFTEAIRFLFLSLVSPL
jgi:hypothetical protein